MYDLVIRNGWVIDGTGAPRRRADVAIAEGRVVAVGTVSGQAKRTIDARDRIVVPGFIDPHTHYDAQICWDPLLSCSSWHGVTTAIMGHCGVGLAPCRPEMREQIAMDLVTIESIPFEVLEAGVTWDWVSFGDYLGAAERRGLGINVGFMAALTPLRRWVMGADATERAASAEETAAIAAQLDAAMEAGAFGFSTTFLAHHFGDQGKPLACRLASREELAAYGAVLKRRGVGVIEAALSETGIIGDYEHELLSFLADASERPVTWVFLLARDDRPEAAFESLERTAALIERRCLPQVMPTPLTIEFDLHNPAISLSNMASWKPLFGQDAATQLAAYRDPAFRAATRRDMAEWGLRWPWERTEIRQVSAPALAALEGRVLAEVAAERGQDPLDTFLDIALEDELRARYAVRLFNVDPERVGKLITDPRTLLGLSDAGAHIDVFCTADYCTNLLGTWVRDVGVMSLERAIQRITAEPADYFGIVDRGRLLEGLAADIVVFDERTIDSLQRTEMVHDFPGGLGRLVMRASGIDYTIVNGTVLYEPGQRDTGARPGRVVRPGAGRGAA